MFNMYLIVLINIFVVIEGLNVYWTELTNPPWFFLLDQR